MKPGRRSPGPALAAGLLTFALLALVELKAARFRPLLLDRLFPGGGWLEVLAFAIYAGTLTHVLADGRRWRKVRPWLWLAFSLFFFLQLLLGLAGFSGFLMTGKLHLPVPALILGGPIYRGGGFFMPVLFACTLLIVGPAWCSWLCYIGSWDLLAARGTKMPRTLFRGSQWVRLSLLLLVVAAALALRASGAPAWLAAAGGAAFGLLGVAIMMVYSRQRGLMIHCTVWCPLGLAAVVLGKLSPFRLRIGKECDLCGACSRVCRYEALAERHLRRRRPGLTCTLCGDCLPVCRSGQIRYRFFGLPASAARGLFLVLVVSLHASFMAVARI